MKCPNCGSDNSKEFEMETYILEKVVSGKRVMKGRAITIDGEYRSDMKRYQCNDCGTMYGSIEASDSAQKQEPETAGQIRQLVYEIWCEKRGSCRLTFDVEPISENIHYVYVEGRGGQTLEDLEQKESVRFRRKMMPREWAEMEHTLLHHYFLKSWSEDYGSMPEPNATKWSIRLELESGKMLHTQGDGVYAPYWDEVSALLLPYVKEVDAL